MFHRLKAALSGGPNGDVFAECRRCGTRVDNATCACDTCGSTDVATYDL